MLIYLVHPVHTEAVTSIVGRSELFSACFFVGSWLLFPEGTNNWSSGSVLLALLSKENAIVLPAILRWIFSAETTAVRLVDESKSPATARLEGEFPAGMDAARVALIYLALRFSVLGSIGIPVSAQYMAGRLTTIQRLLTAGRVFIRYRLSSFSN